MIDWFKKRWQWIVGAVLVVLGAGWLWQRRSWLNSRARLEVAILEKEIASKTATRDYLLTEGQQDFEAIERLDRQIEETQRVILAHHENVEGLTREQIRERLARLGYN